MADVTNDLFLGQYKGKRVLVTGHTGFKGSWLSMWLLALGAEVLGYSAYFPSDPCNFKACHLENHIRHVEGDIRDYDHLLKVFTDYQPEIVFHLAAQPIVRKSFDEPKLTFDTNLGGTVNILECIRHTPSVQVTVMITSDKCYQNNEWEWGYRETDTLGGDDPYSASKACAEIGIHAYIESFFTSPDSPKIASVRAGNVIGGGDWGESRIIPDCVRAWSKKQDVTIRNPEATRPWQHVLEPLSGYLSLGAGLYQDRLLHGEAFNFGPDAKINQSVGELINEFSLYWANAKWNHEKDTSDKKESGLLKLSCDKALHRLKWHSTLSFSQTIKLTAEWYQRFYESQDNIFQFTMSQIEYYISEARKQNQVWVEGAV